jgi:5-hydroxyisourate hydrolase-like protein (transthyretin family)
MTPPQKPPTPRRVAGSARAGLLSATVLAALTPAVADAGLIPVPGPWPTAVSDATNPLAGTAVVANGTYATTNASLHVWLADGGQRRTTITRTIGRPTAVAGRLRSRDTSHSIGGAIVTLVVQNVYHDDWSVVTTTRTDRKGRFRVILPSGFHRRVAILYYPDVNAPVPVYSRRLLVRASSRVWLASPSHKKRTFRFDGTVSGAPVPPSGLLVALQVLNRSSHWITARLTNTNRDGRFHFRYHFEPGRLTLRVLAPSQTGWLLFGGVSRTRTIRPR